MAPLYSDERKEYSLQNKVETEATTIHKCFCGGMECRPAASIIGPCGWRQAIHSELLQKCGEVLPVSTYFISD